MSFSGEEKYMDSWKDAIDNPKEGMTLTSPSKEMLAIYRDGKWVAYYSAELFRKTLEGITNLIKNKP
jgi:hypothetical protein